MIKRDHSIIVKDIECVNSLGTWYNITLDNFPYLFKVVSESSYGLYDLNMLAVMSYVSLDQRIYKCIIDWEIKKDLSSSTLDTFQADIDEL